MNKEQSQEKATIHWDDLKKIGIDPFSLSKETKEKIERGEKTGPFNFAIDDTAENRKRVNEEKVDYKVEDGKIKFEGKIKAEQYSTVDNTEDIKVKLKNNDIEYKEEGNKLKLDKINTQKLLILGVTLVYPVAGIALMVIPKRNEIKNDFSFSKDEINALNENKIVVKDNLKGEKTLYQRDADTNEIVSVKAKDISIPNKINGVDLTPMQKELLLNGKDIVITNNELQQSATVRLDLNATNGLSITPLQQEQKEHMSRRAANEEKQDIKQDVKQDIRQEEKTHINKETKQSITDEDRLKLIESKGAKGIDEAFKENESEKVKFLKKYNLSYSYSEYKEVDSRYSSAQSKNDTEQVSKLHTRREEIDTKIRETAHSYIGQDIQNSKKEGIKI